jgi:8-hydroxy-5-deazaflavin:NADPH oxidoreductase
MKVGIFGTGDVGRALGRAFVTLGHEVKLGAREATNEKALAWVKEVGGKASAGTFAEAAEFADLVVLATLGSANEAVLAAAGPDRLAGKILIDATNPLSHEPGGAPGLAISGNDSGGEQVQRFAPKAHVVKAFNIVGNAHMFRPDFPGGPPDMFFCGNDEGAKAKVTALLRDFGWNPIDLGDLRASRYLEAMCIAWVLYALKQGGWNHAFKMLKK